MTEPPKVAQPNLAAAFTGGGSTDRSASLSGLLPKRTTAPAQKRVQTPPAAPQGAEEADVATDPQAEPPKPAKTRKRPAAAPDSTSTIYDVGVYLDPPVVQALRAKRREGVSPGEPEHTYDELLVEALRQVDQRDLAAAFAVEPRAAADGVPLRVRRPKGTGTTLIQHRLTAAQRDYLDRLASSSGAPSRSALVNAVYKIAFDLN